MWTNALAPPKLIWRPIVCGLGPTDACCYILIHTLSSAIYNLWVVTKGVGKPIKYRWKFSFERVLSQQLTSINPWWSLKWRFLDYPWLRLTLRDELSRAVLRFLITCCPLNTCLFILVSFDSTYEKLIFANIYMFMWIIKVKWAKLSQTDDG